MTLVEFGQEVSGPRFLGLMEIAHYVGLLLPDMDCFLELHLALESDSTQSDSVVELQVMTSSLFI